MSHLDLFKTNFLAADSWELRKDGTPLYLLDALDPDELREAERLMIRAASLHDNWPIIGLGYIKSAPALPVLYKLLQKSSGVKKIIIAHSIFQISHDDDMKSIVLETMPLITREDDLIEVLYYLPDFKDERITELHRSYCDHPLYLVAYNATRYLGLPTDDVVEKFRKKPGSGQTSPNYQAPKRNRSWWEILLGIQ